MDIKISELDLTGTPPAALFAIEQLLRIVCDAEEVPDIEADDIRENIVDAWRKARGEAGMQDWRWHVKGSGDEGYHGEYKSREEAIAAIPDLHRGGDRQSDDGQFEICEARDWADMFDADGREIIMFADARHHEELDFSHLVNGEAA